MAKSKNVKNNLTFFIKSWNAHVSFDGIMENLYFAEELHELQFFLRTVPDINAFFHPPLDENILALVLQ